MRISPLAAAAAVLLLAAASISAVPIESTVELEVTFVEDGITDLVVGDKYLLNFTIEDSVADTNATGNGAYPNLVTSWSMAANISNLGTWAPSGTPDLTGGNYVTNSFGENGTFEIAGSLYPDGGAGLPFDVFDFYFDWPQDIDAAGAGGSFADHLVTPFGIPPADPLLTLRFALAGERGDFVVAELQPAQDNALEIPTLSHWAMLLMVTGLGVLGLRRLA